MTSVDDLRHIIDEESDSVLIHLAGGGELRVAATVDDVVEDSEPEKEELPPDAPVYRDYAWHEGRMTVDCWTPEAYEDENGYAAWGEWTSGYLRLQAETSEGEWPERVELLVDDPEKEDWFRSPYVDYGVEEIEILEDGAVEDDRGSSGSGIDVSVDERESNGDGGENGKEGESYDDLVADSESTGEQTDEEVLSAEEYRAQRARERVQGVRPRSMKRVIVADEIVQYAASDEGQSEVWREYIARRDDDLFPAAIDEFIGDYLGVARFRKLLVEDAGTRILGEDEIEEWFDVGDRTLRDVLLLLRHFRAE